MSDLSEIFEALAGKRIEGGCDRCNAFQTVSKDYGVHIIHVHHDDWCPTWRRIQARGEAG
jgi:hypothetical protein